MLVPWTFFFSFLRIPFSSFCISGSRFHSVVAGAVGTSVFVPCFFNGIASALSADADGEYRLCRPPTSRARIFFRCFPFALYWPWHRTICGRWVEVGEWWIWQMMGVLLIGSRRHCDRQLMRGPACRETALRLLWTGNADHGSIGILSCTPTMWRCRSITASLAASVVPERTRADQTPAAGHVDRVLGI